MSDWVTLVIATVSAAWAIAVARMRRLDRSLLDEPVLGIILMGAMPDADSDEIIHFVGVRALDGHDVYVTAAPPIADRLIDKMQLAAQTGMGLMAHIPREKVHDLYEWQPCPLCGAKDQIEVIVVGMNFVATTCEKCEQPITSSTMPLEIDLEGILGETPDNLL